MNDSQPVFVQIMEAIESDIMTGVYQTDDLIISTNQIAKLYGVNPTTAVKAVAKLTDAGVLYKRRGIGMCVAPGASAMISQRRRAVFMDQTIPELLAEAATLGLTLEELIDVIQTKKGTTND
ncbi:MAG: GntR family transcriptional regulator [Propionibacteriaceae bacterium]|nr:GntR family transcriptional regulator [Propionibacteriaceae bacterium]